VLDVLRRSGVVATLTDPLDRLWRRTFKPSRSEASSPAPRPKLKLGRWADWLWNGCVAALAVYAIWRVASFVSGSISLQEVGRALLLGLATLARVIILIAAATLIWVPVGVMVGMRPRVAQLVQPVVQIMAAFPANVLFPIAVSAIVLLKIDPNIWLSPLMILGTQWYILFNVIAGAAAIPSEMRDVGTNLQIRGWLWWKKIALPAVFPYYLTGAITASGGSWNASIVAEVASWGHTRLEAFGLGAYIAQATDAGDFHRIVLGVAVMSFYVVVINRAFWRPLYWYAERKFRLE
jgi:NitT/TauT family transport system permease protein